MASNNRTALEQLNKALKRSTDATLGLVSPLSNLQVNFASIQPLYSGINKLVGGVANLIGPVNGLFESMSKSDDLQKKFLGVNTNLKNFMAENTEALKGLRGGLFENAEELFENFSDGIRFNSQSLNVLQNRMKLTGQSTDLVRKVTKQLIGATNNNIESIGRLSKSNMELGRTYMISNEKLLEALDRNAETLDFASLFDEGEQTAEAIMNLTAQMTAKGIEVKKQDQIIKFLGDQTIEGAQTRQKLGLSVDVLDKIATGQTSLEKVLGQVSDFSKQSLITAKGSAKKLATDIALQGLGDGIKQVVIASNQVNAALKTPDADLKKLQSKEDKYYDTFETSVKEAKNFYDKTVTEFYDVMKPTPDLLKAIQVGILAGTAGSVVGGAVGKVGEAVSTGFPKIGKALGIVGGLAGPIGLLAGVAVPMLLDGLGSFFDKSEEQKQKDQSEATLKIAKDFQSSLQDSKNITNVLQNITSADKEVNALRDELISVQENQISKINSLMGSIKQTGNEELLAQFESDAANQIKTMNKIIAQAKMGNLTSEQLKQLNQKASDESKKFFAGIDSNTKFTSIHLKNIRENGIQTEPKKEKKPEMPEVEHRASLEDILHQALGRALSNGAPKKDDNKDKELLLELRELNRISRMQYDADRRSKSSGWAGG